MIVVGLLAVAGVVWFLVAQLDTGPKVVTTVATQNGELVPTTNVIEIFNVPVGQSVSSEFELINIGAGPVDIKDVLVDGDESITASSACDTLEPEESCLVTVTFSPGEPGEFGAVLKVEHSGVNGNLELPVVGTSIEPPEAFVSVDPINLDFGVVPLGEGDFRSVEITNAGNVEIHIGSIGIDSGLFVRDDAANEASACKSLAPGASCSVNVRFIAAEPGAFDGILFIDHDGDNPSLAVRLAGVVPEHANPIIEILDMTDTTNNSPADPDSTGTATMAITNTGQTATTATFDYRIERLNPQIGDLWVAAFISEETQAGFTSEEIPAGFTFEGSIGPGETVIVTQDLEFPTSDYESGDSTEIRAEVDSCFATELIEVPPCRIAESNEEDNVSVPQDFQVFYETIE